MTDYVVRVPDKVEIDAQELLSVDLIPLLPAEKISSGILAERLIPRSIARQHDVEVLVNESLELTAELEHIHPLVTPTQSGFMSPAEHVKLANIPDDIEAPTIQSIDGLATALNSKAATEHDHNLADVSGLQDALNSRAFVAHNHSIDQVNGLQAVLDSKGWTVQVVTGSQTITAQPNYWYFCLSSNGPITINLPINPSVANRIRVSHLSLGLSNVTLIGRNGKAIRANSVSEGLEFFNLNTSTQNACATLTFVGDALGGWSYEATGSVRVRSANVLSFVRAVDGDPDIAEFLGRNSGSAAWGNPQSVNSGVQPRMAVLTSGASTVSSLLEATNRATGGTSTTSASGMLFPHSVLIIFNRENFNREVRLSELSVRSHSVAGSASAAWRNFRIDALKNTDYAGMSATEPETSFSNFNSFMGLPGWTPVARFVGNTTMTTTVNAWANYPISAIAPNQPDFYSAFRIQSTGLSADGANLALNFGELQFYGELRT